MEVRIRRDMREEHGDEKEYGWYTKCVKYDG